MSRKNFDLTIDVKPFSTISHNSSIGYFQPAWSALPLTDHTLFTLDVWKEGTIAHTIPLTGKPFFLIGRNHTFCDVTLANPTVSRVHCALQYNAKGEMFLYDINTGYGTFLNGERIAAQTYVKLKDGDTFKVAQSKKMFIINGVVKEEEKSEDKEKKKNKNTKKDKEIVMMRKEIGFNNESNWGIEDYDEEIAQYQEKEDIEEENNNNIDDIREIKERTDLTDKQKEYISKIEDLIAERDGVLAQKDKLKYELEDEENEKDKNKYKKIQSKNFYLNKRVIEIKEKIISFKNRLVESIKSVEQNKIKFDRKKVKEYNEDSDDDEYYDRTKKEDNTIEEKEPEEAEDIYDNLKRRLEILIQDKQRLQDKIQAQKYYREHKTHTIDSLDRYFLEHGEGNESSSIEEQLRKVNEEIKEKESLLNYISPFNLNIKSGSSYKKDEGFKMPIPVNRNVQQKKPNKESIVSVMEKFKNLQEKLVNQKMKEEADIENKEKEIQENIEREKEAIKIDEEMQIKLSEYEKSLTHRTDTEQIKPNSEKSLFKEIVANVGNSNFQIEKYPEINKLYESKKKKKTRAKIDLPDEEEYLGSLLGEKRDRGKEDGIKIYGPDPIPKQDQIDIFDLQNKGKWTETNVSSNPFSKLLGDNE